MSTAFQPAVWDATRHVAVGLARGPWRELIGATVEVLSIVEELTGEPVVDPDDPEPVTFAFLLVAHAVDGIVPDRELADDLLQWLASEIYFQVPEDKLPRPDIFWEEMTKRVGGSRTSSSRANSPMGLVPIVETFLTAYDLGGRDNGDIVFGLYEAVHPIVRQMRTDLRTRYPWLLKGRIALPL